MSLAVGIDLGTSYCSVGVFRNDQFEEIPNDDGEFLTPSMVAFNDTECLIGDEAKRQLSRNPCNTIFDALRFNGLRFADAEVQADMRHFPFIVRDQCGEPVIQVQYNGRDKVLTTVEVMSMLLWKMKALAEEYLHCAVRGAVVTCPACWDMSKRQSIRDAAEIAELNILRIIDSSTCAALAFTNSRKVDGEMNVLFYDLGGGNFNVTLATIEEGLIEVKSVAGDNHLGGEDFNNRLVNHFVNDFSRRNQKRDLSTSPRALCRLRAACEQAKRDLSASTMTTLEIDSLFDGIDFRSTITRARFEELNQDLFRSTTTPVDRVLADARLERSKVHAIVLIGGSTRIPRVQNVITHYFNGKEPLKSLNPDSGPCYGASMQAALLAGDTSSKSLNEIYLLDVQPISLGVEGMGGQMLKLLPRNTSIPTKKSEHFVTTAEPISDGQERRMRAVVFPLSVYEGERQRVKDNRLLAKLEKIDIPYPSLRQIRITFDVDANSVLTVSVHDMDSRKIVEPVTIRVGQLSREEIKRMQAERPRPNKILAEEHAEDDESRISAKIELQSQVFFFRTALESFKLLKWLSLSDIEIMGTATDKMLEWIDENKNASSYDYAFQRNELVALERRAMDLVHKVPWSMGLP